ncbi:MAG: type II toxin-antitoxin system RelE/ParE family toxin [Ktedonobacteraceae bacterium]
MDWNIVISPTAQKQLANISDRRINRSIENTIDSLDTEPTRKGKPLIGDLAGYRAIRTVGQRYRVIFRLYNDQNIVYIASVGIRNHGDKNDVYAIAKKLVKAGLF